MKTILRFSIYLCLAAMILTGSSCSENAEESPEASNNAAEVQASGSRYTISGKEIVSISANIMNHPEGGQDIASFEIPKEFFGRVIEFVEGADEFSVQIDPMLRGGLTIKTTNGEIEIMLFCPAQSDDIIFTAEGGKFTGNSLREFVGVVEEAREAASTQ